MSNLKSLNDLFKRVYNGYWITHYVKDEYNYYANLDRYYNHNKYEELYEQTQLLQEKINEFFRTKYWEFEKTEEFKRRDKEHKGLIELLYNSKNILLKEIPKVTK